MPIKVEQMGQWSMMNCGFGLIVLRGVEKWEKERKEECSGWLDKRVAD